MDTAYVRGKPPPKQPYFRFSFYHFRYLKFLGMKPEVARKQYTNNGWTSGSLKDRWYIINHPVGSIYHLYTTYSPCQLGDFILPTSPTTYFWEPGNSIDNSLLSKSWSDDSKGKTHDCRPFSPRPPARGEDRHPWVQCGGMFKCMARCPWDLKELDEEGGKPYTTWRIIPGLVSG